ncbi:class F sortase [Actinopolymorpha alba]|uniref:class F sortase n=1 Tax=Actinopolymorpha alba TaxID=533267 RepID=UPI000364B916|nr:class F sortase [Actinopolymorpha alba]
MDDSGKLVARLGAVLGIAVFAALAVWGPFAGPDGLLRAASSPRPTPTPTVPQLPPAPPERIAIPRLGVDARVVATPVGPRRTLLPPRSPRLVGWWSGGAPPGVARGGTVIAGHTVHTGGGALDDLHLLKAGDQIDVRTPSGLIRYRVEEVRAYHKATLARDAERVFDQSVPARLVVVTCDDWNGQEYLSNIVAFATPVRAVPRGSVES